MVASKTNPYDIFSPHTHPNHQLYEQMRREDPIHAALEPLSGHTFWFLTRYEDCLNFLKDKRFGKEFRYRLPSQLAETWLHSNTDSSVNQHMLNLDEPAHARLKALVHLAFTPIRINQLRPKLQAIAEVLLDALEPDESETFDLTDGYLNKLSLMSLIEMLGFPQSDYPKLLHWTNLMLGTEQSTVQPAIIEFTSYLQTAIAARQSHPNKHDDLLSALVFAEDAGDKLTHEELLAMVYLILTAGYETMVTFLSNGILTLMNHPQQLHKLRKNLHHSTVLKSSIEEMLRFHGAAHMTLASWAYEDVAIGNHLVHQGDVVHAMLHAANRDPLIFANPNQFDILRSPNKHIAFSYGIHHCLGAALARLEGEIAIETLLRRFPQF